MHLSIDERSAPTGLPAQPDTLGNRVSFTCAASVRTGRISLNEGYPGVRRVSALRRVRWGQHPSLQLPVRAGWRCGGWKSWPVAAQSPTNGVRAPSCLRPSVLRLIDSCRQPRLRATPRPSERESPLPRYRTRPLDLRQEPAVQPRRHRHQRPSGVPRDDLEDFRASCQSLFASAQDAPQGTPSSPSPAKCASTVASQPRPAVRCSPGQGGR
jgi:hypothetical protein